MKKVIVGTKVKEFPKDPNAKLDYGFDWSDWLEENEWLVRSEWLVPLGLIMNAPSHDDATTTVWLDGGRVGQKYWVVNRIRTNKGRTDERGFWIIMTDRRST